MNGGICANGSFFVPTMAQMAMKDAWRQSRVPYRWAMRIEQRIAIENIAIDVEIVNVEEVREPLDVHLADRDMTLMTLPIEIDPRVPEGEILLLDKDLNTITRIFMLAIPHELK